MCVCVDKQDLLLTTWWVRLAAAAADDDDDDDDGDDTDDSSSSGSCNSHSCRVIFATTSTVIRTSGSWCIFQLFCMCWP